MYLKKNGLIKVKLNSKMVLAALFILSIFAYHRSGWTTLFVMIFALVILRKIKASRIAITALGAAFLLFSSFVYYLPFLTLKFEGIFSPAEDSTGIWRLEVWSSIIDVIINQAHYLGKGIGDKFLIYVPFYRAFENAGPHSGYFSVLYFLGIPGIILFCFMLLASLIKFYKAYKRTNNEEFKYVMLLGIITLLGNITYMINYESEIFSWVFFSTAVVISSKINMGSENEEQ